MSLEEQATTTPTTEAPETTPVETVEAAPAATTDAYQPDYGYMHNDEKKEIDEFWRPLIKDKDTEARVRDFVQRANAVEEYKSRLPEYESKVSQYEQTVNTVNEIKSLYDKGDHERALEAIGYTDEMLFKVVEEKLKRMKMPEQERQSYEEKRRLQLENEQIRRENENARARYSEEITRTIDYQLTQELGKPEYQQMAKMYEAANGEGSFRRLVIERGAFLGNLRGGVTIPPHELLKIVQKEYQPFMVGNQTALPVNQRSNLKVVPNVGVGNASPAKSQPRSIDDLRKLAQQMSGADE